MLKILKYFIESLTSSDSKEEIKKFKFSHLKRIFPYLKIHHKKGLIASIFMILVSLLTLPIPYLMKFVIDDIILKNNIKLLNLIIVLLLVIRLTRSFFSFFANSLFNIFSQEIMTKIKKDLFNRLLCLPLSFFDKNQSGYLLSRIKEIENLGLLFSDTLVKVMISVLEFLFCLIILIYLNWRLTIFSLLILPLFYVVTNIASKELRKQSREVLEKEAVLSSQLQDSLSGINVVKVFTAEERETEKIGYYLDEAKNTRLKQNIKYTFYSEIISLLSTAGGFLVLWYSGLDIIRGNFTIGGYIAFSAYLIKLYGPTHILATIGLSIQRVITALERLSELMNLNVEEREKGIKFNKIKGDIEFSDVSFSYDTKRVLSNINFKIKQGEKILIIGPNGSGKTTIAKLILGLYKIKKGKIIIDNYNLNEISPFSLRKRISVISQNTFLFNDTIKNNMLFSRPEAKDKEVEEAARLSGAYEFILKLKEGYNTTVGENGKKLSGGEKQKIAVTRAILKDSDVIIFDEATTHLDKKSENRIENLFKNNLKNKTCLIISHKIKNIFSIDRIFVLKSGKLLDQGEHSQLFHRCNFYRKLLEKQVMKKHPIDYKSLSLGKLTK